MTTAEWVEIGALDEIAEGTPVLRKVGARRFLCVRDGQNVHGLDERCPHQGYPLSQGTVLGGVLTCAWHNWKFELASGTCTTGGDAVKRYPSRVEGGRVYLDVAVDREVEAARAARGIREGLLEGDVPRVVRDGLRLGTMRDGAAELAPTGPAFAEAVIDAADRAPWGFGHDLSATADVVSFVADGRLPASEALGIVATLVGELWTARPPRAPTPAAATPVDIVSALREERREDAEAGARRCARQGGIEEAVDAMAPFLATGILDYGHGAIHAAKAIELGRRFPEAAEPIAASLAVMLGWATNETALPPFAASRRALGELPLRVGDRPLEAAARTELEASTLESEAAALAATLTHLRAGVDPRRLLLASARAAARRVLRFDHAWEKRTDLDAGRLDVTHLVTYAEACWTLTARPAFAPHAARFALLAAGFVGKLRRADGAPPEPRAGETMACAIAARDLGAARGAAAQLDRAARAAAFREAAPFAAHDAFVRPIFIAHAIKMLEALRRLDEVDDAIDDSTHLEALFATILPRGQERSIRRVARTAEAFLEDGRPPAGLY